MPPAGPGSSTAARVASLAHRCWSNSTTNLRASRPCCPSASACERSRRVSSGGLVRRSRPPPRCAPGAHAQDDRHPNGGAAPASVCGCVAAHHTVCCRRGHPAADYALVRGAGSPPAPAGVGYSSLAAACNAEYGELMERMGRYIFGLHRISFRRRNALPPCTLLYMIQPCDASHLIESNVPRFAPRTHVTMGTGIVGASRG